MKLKLWRRNKQPQQEQQRKRESSSSMTAAERSSNCYTVHGQGQGSSFGSSEDVNGRTCPLHRDEIDEGSVSSHKSPLQQVAAEQKQQESSSTSEDLTPTRRRRLFGQTKDKSASSPKTRHALSTRDLLEASRQEREESIAQGLAHLHGMEDHAKLLWKKRLIVDDTSSEPSVPSKVCSAQDAAPLRRVEPIAATVHH
jgi:hypothetical protein